MFSRTFWNLVSGFVLILVLSFSLLTVFSVFEDSKDSMTALFEAFREESK